MVLEEATIGSENILVLRYFDTVTSSHKVFLVSLCAPIYFQKRNRRLWNVPEFDYDERNDDDDDTVGSNDIDAGDLPNDVLTISQSLRQTRNIITTSCSSSTSSSPRSPRSSYYGYSRKRSEKSMNRKKSVREFIASNGLLNAYFTSDEEEEESGGASGGKDSKDRAGRLRRLSSKGSGENRRNLDEDGGEAGDDEDEDKDVESEVSADSLPSDDDDTFDVRYTPAGLLCRALDAPADILGVGGEIDKNSTNKNSPAPSTSTAVGGSDGASAYSSTATLASSASNGTNSKPKGTENTSENGSADKIKDTHVLIPYNSLSGGGGGGMRVELPIPPPVSALSKRSRQQLRRKSLSGERSLTSTNSFGSDKSSSDDVSNTDPVATSVNMVGVGMAFIAGGPNAQWYSSELFFRVEDLTEPGRVCWALMGRTESGEIEVSSHSLFQTTLSLTSEQGSAATMEAQLSSTTQGTLLGRSQESSSSPLSSPSVVSPSVVCPSPVSLSPVSPSPVSPSLTSADSSSSSSSPCTGTRVNVRTDKSSQEAKAAARTTVVHNVFPAREFSTVRLIVPVPVSKSWVGASFGSGQNTLITLRGGLSVDAMAETAHQGLSSPTLHGIGKSASLTKGRLALSNRPSSSSLHTTGTGNASSHRTASRTSLATNASLCTETGSVSASSAKTDARTPATTAVQTIVYGRNMIFGQRSLGEGEKETGRSGDSKKSKSLNGETDYLRTDPLRNDSTIPDMESKYARAHHCLDASCFLMGSTRSCLLIVQASSNDHPVFDSGFRAAYDGSSTGRDEYGEEEEELEEGNEEDTEAGKHGSTKFLYESCISPSIGANLL